MQDVTPLKLDLIESLARMPQAYDDVQEIWRTSCPRLPVWEEVIEQRLVEQGPDGLLIPSAAGHTFLAHHGRQVG